MTTRLAVAVVAASCYPLSATWPLARPQPWRCAEPAMAERLRRIRLQRPALADRIEQECVR